MSAEAPAGLELLRAFVNTLDPDDGTDALGDRASLSAWLRAHGLLGADGEAAAGDLQRAHRLRRAVHRIAVANHDGVVDEAAVEEVDTLAGECHLVVHLGPEGKARLQPASSGVGGALAGLLATLYTATVDGTWSRFKVCRNDTCRWAFYDGSRNHSGRFCGTACANAVNARAYRRRKSDSTA